MKILIVVYNSGIQEDVDRLLEDLQPPGFTLAEGVRGVGGTGRKFGDAIWPGTNNMLYIALPDDQVARYADAFSRLKESFRVNPGVSVFALPMEDWTGFHLDRTSDPSELSDNSSAVE